HTGRRRDCDGLAPALLDPEPPRRALSHLSRPKWMDARPPDRVRSPPDRSGPLPAPGRVPRLAAPGPTARMSLLEVSGLLKRFGGLLAVGGLDLSMAEGEMLGLIGPNGAGKTTVFNLLSGFLVPDDCEIGVAGGVLGGLKPPEICRLGLPRPSQIGRPSPQPPVLDNVKTAPPARPPAMPVALEAARAVVDRVGLGSRARELAGGLTLAD